jgi:hypothetical protein
MLSLFVWVAIGISIFIAGMFFKSLNLDWMLVTYAIGAVTIGVAILREDIEHTFVITKKNKRLGASYWGVYQGSELQEAQNMQTINPPKPCKDIEGVAGSGTYAGGKAVKSAR